MFRLATSSVVALALATPPAGPASVQQIVLPRAEKSVRFAVIGDSGTGGSAQLRVAQRLAEARAGFPFEFSLMLGDNLYGGEAPSDVADKFERPYKPLLDAGVKFYAALGNHDDPNQRFYKPFNMNGERYYSFKPAEGSVRFFALDSNYMDQAQVAWLEKELAASDSDWKICFFHHPLYSSGDKHGADTKLRELLEPIFVKHGVDLVFDGARALLRASQAAAGDQLHHRRERRQAAARQHRTVGEDGEGLRRRLCVHADGDRRQRTAFPDHHRRREDHRLGHDAVEDHPHDRRQEPRVGITARRPRPG